MKERTSQNLRFPRGLLSSTERFRLSLGASFLGIQAIIEIIKYDTGNQIDSRFHYSRPEFDQAPHRYFLGYRSSMEGGKST